MLVRKATEADATSIAPLILLAMEEIAYQFTGERSMEKATDFFVKMISQKANQYSYENCWVAEHEGEIIATALVYDGARLSELRKPVAEQIKLVFGKNFNPGDETQPGEYYIDCIGVKPGQQGKGIGSKMLNFLIEAYAKTGTQPLGLLVDKDNPQAKKLYLRSGFEVVEEKVFAGKSMEHLQYKCH
ncbi:MAG: GNAT family N-acetyltransferase [Terrimonas sp.]|nr:GNAT family N-acetyltransferase [Terrimonas sp.]OJY88887.1 MAG: GNAT family N-acetyltransferase [Sphingobacteriales bacterium 40-81]